MNNVKTIEIGADVIEKTSTKPQKSAFIHTFLHYDIKRFRMTETSTKRKISESNILT